MTQWYYSDYQRNRHGPVRASDLAELHHAGQLTPDTLVWNETMPDWRPWREVMNLALAEAQGRTLPSQEATPLSAGVNPYAMAEPALATASGASVAATPLSGGVNPYSIAEPSSPYAPPRAALNNAYDYVGGGNVVYAGFWKRFAAAIIDGVLIFIVTWILQMVVMFGVFGVSMAGGASPENFGSSASMVVAMIFIYLAPIAMQALYYAYMHSSDYQATLGKMAVGIKVTDDGGQRISFMRGIGRFFATWLSSIVLMIGYIMAAFTDRKQALHDIVASTLVVDKWAFTSHPERQNEELGTVTIVIIAIGVLMILGAFAMFAVAMMAVAAGS